MKNDGRKRIESAGQSGDTLVNMAYDFDSICNSNLFVIDMKNYIEEGILNEFIDKIEIETCSSGSRVIIITTNTFVQDSKVMDFIDIMLKLMKPPESVRC